jgi:hypothetical protein
MLLVLFSLLLFWFLFLFVFRLLRLLRLLLLRASRLNNLLLLVFGGSWLNVIEGGSNQYHSSKNQVVGGPNGSLF